MFIVQGDRAVNIAYCELIKVDGTDIKCVMPSFMIGALVSKCITASTANAKVATFDTAEKAQEYLSLILKAYEKGDKVFYC